MVSKKSLLIISLLLLCIFIFVGCSPSNQVPEEETDPNKIIVWVNETTKIYHKLTCRYIPEEKGPNWRRLTKKEASLDGYSSCKHCKP